MNPKIAWQRPNGFTKSNGGGEGSGTVSWNEIQNKPSEFKPEPHEHEIADIINLQELLDELLKSTDNNNELIIELEKIVNNKVDKEDGKGLSSNDFTDDFKKKLEELEVGGEITALVESVNGKTGVVVITKEDVDLGNVINVKQASEEEFLEFKNQVVKELENKVDKVQGKGLSTHDFDATYKEYIDSLYAQGIGMNGGGEGGGEIPEAPVLSVNEKTGHVTITKADLDLGNVDNVKQASKEEFDKFKEKTNTELEKKVNKEEGKGLSSNDFTNEMKDKLENLPENIEVPVTSVNGKTGDVVIEKKDLDLDNVLNIEQASKAEHDILKSEVETLRALQDNKVDKIDGKGLSSNDFTDAEKELLKEISEAEPIEEYVISVNGKSGKVTITKEDLNLGNVENIKQASYEDLINLKTIVENNQKDIANKVDKKAGFGLSQENFTPELKKKLEGMESGGSIEPSGDYVISVNGKTGEVTIDKETVNLGNVINERQATQEELQLVQESIIELLKEKVDKEEGKGLSEANFTKEEKEKLEKLEPINVEEELKYYATKVDLEAHAGNETIHLSESDRESLAKLDTIDGELVEIDNKLNQKATKEEVQKLELDKVDKVEGMGLSETSFTKVEKEKLASLEKVDTDTFAKKSDLDAHIENKDIHVSEEDRKQLGKIDNLEEELGKATEGLDKKVDKVEGKGLSTNDYTTAEKDSVATIPELQKSVDKNTKDITLAVKFKEETNEIEEVTKAATNTPLEEVAVRNSVIVKNLDEVPEDMLHEGLIAIVLD